MSLDLVDDEKKISISTDESEIEEENLEELDNEYLEELYPDLQYNNTKTILSNIKKKKRKKVKASSIEKLPKLNTDKEFKSLLKNLESIESRLNEMDSHLDNSIRWISNVCIIIVLGMIVLVLTLAAIAIVMINKFV